jgi:putative sigma-54 modulation protein
MNLHVSGHQVEVTQALRDYVSSKFERIERHFDHLIDVNVILNVEKLSHKAEATLTTRGKTLYADAIAEDMYAAIDLLLDKLDRMVLKHKEKLTDHHRGESRIASAG